MLTIVAVELATLENQLQYQKKGIHNLHRPGGKSTQQSVWHQNRKSCGDEGQLCDSVYQYHRMGGALGMAE